ncbi:MAG TPA: RdgB/HAM1 family non-canonical purine NTP pyrophosphatase [Burkholderiales bacterium]|nr:RdgB/HAM1 family non-canonical purine NTP pyrophosphatase [Burkholderiales bacterium]
MRRLVLASDNPGKLREFRQLCEPLGLTIIPQSEWGITGAEEPYCTFVENALAKARHASRASGLPAFADDSGICVAALGGAPGVRSARFAEVSGETQDARNNAKLIEMLVDKTDRSAHYTCVIVLVRHAGDPEPLIAEGRWEGEILAEPRGSGGFGYDPYFFVAALNQSAAELPAHEKNRISHRGKALARLAEKLGETD